MVVGDRHVPGEKFARALVEIARRGALGVVREHELANAGRLGHLARLAGRTMPAHAALDIVGQQRRFADEVIRPPPMSSAADGSYVRTSNTPLMKSPPPSSANALTS